ncbi:hypothetical protein NDU88_009975 [Pleurodeles waltl]|uniref:Uncharacterized protein n=1 Tax=Pleurodeles waltl TaxID=8319 RepID=A0AAV7QUL5_PLEWA|nr:hypothetical protein NDU88_009975 [Pleurodeles waltl]
MVGGAKRIDNRAATFRFSKMNSFFLGNYAAASEPSMIGQPGPTDPNDSSVQGAAVTVRQDSRLEQIKHHLSARESDSARLNADEEGVRLDQAVRMELVAQAQNVQSGEGTSHLNSDKGADKPQITAQIRMQAACKPTKVQESKVKSKSTDS